MDNYTTGGIGAISVIVVGIIYKLCHHFKCTSMCCGSNTSLKIDINESPNNETPLRISIPTQTTHSSYE
jgi:hypothetical protein